LTGGQGGPGITGLGLMAFLASGEDPNFGLYSNNVRRCVRSLINGQDGSTGYFGAGMYDHVCDAGAGRGVRRRDDRQVWPNGKGRERSVWRSNSRARLSHIATKNPLGAWRYSPEATDADTSVSGAILVGLLAARNAGSKCPTRPSIAPSLTTRE